MKIDAPRHRYSDGIVYRSIRESDWRKIKKVLDVARFVGCSNALADAVNALESHLAKRKADAAKGVQDE